ncbi:MAG: cytochrome c3 family protein [Desulfosarcinaceae bacterium]
MKRSIMLLSAMLLGVTLLLVPAYSQEDIETLDNSMFKNPRRAAVPFSHDEHNEKADIEDCTVCHHLFDEHGKKIEDESSEDQSCSDCHTSEAVGNRPDLMSAFHRRCKDCHLERHSGPITCGQCHPKP